jgi:hypothetical protein
MKRIELPGGGWADIREPGTGELIDQVTVKGRRGIMVVRGRVSREGRDLMNRIAKMPEGPERDAALEAVEDSLSEDDYNTMMRVTEATLVANLAAWSLDQPLPTTKTVEDLPTPLYDALSEVVAADAASSLDMSLDTDPGDGTPDPKDPSGA